MDYSEKVIDYYTNPRNVGKIEHASGIGNPVCGDIMKMFIKVENNIIVDVKFKTFGCGATINKIGVARKVLLMAGQIEKNHRLQICNFM